MQSVIGILDTPTKELSSPTKERCQQYKGKGPRQPSLPGTEEARQRHRQAKVDERRPGLRTTIKTPELPSQESTSLTKTSLTPSRSKEENYPMADLGGTLQASFFLCLFRNFHVNLLHYSLL